MVTAIYHRTSRVITWRATRGRISHLAANGICFLPPAAFPRLVHSILHDRGHCAAGSGGGARVWARSFTRLAMTRRNFENAAMGPGQARVDRSINDCFDLCPLMRTFKSWVGARRSERLGNTRVGWPPSGSPLVPAFDSCTKGALMNLDDRNTYSSLIYRVTQYPVQFSRRRIQGSAEQKRRNLSWNLRSARLIRVTVQYFLTAGSSSDLTLLA